MPLPNPNPQPWPGPCLESLVIQWPDPCSVINISISLSSTHFSGTFTGTLNRVPIITSTSPIESEFSLTTLGNCCNATPVCFGFDNNSENTGLSQQFIRGNLTINCPSGSNTYLAGWTFLLQTQITDSGICQFMLSIGGNGGPAYISGPTSPCGIVGNTYFMQSEWLDSSTLDGSHTLTYTDGVTTVEATITIS